MNQIERIQLMEQAFNESISAVQNLADAIEQYREVLQKFNALKAYYQSPQWMKDADDDRNGKIPDDLPRGILSEDGIFDLLTDNYELMQAMEEILSMQNDNQLHHFGD